MTKSQQHVCDWLKRFEELRLITAPPCKMQPQQNRNLQRFARRTYSAGAAAHAAEVAAVAAAGAADWVSNTRRGSF